MLRNKTNAIPSLIINENVYRNIKMLGQGGFGEVFLFEIDEEGQKNEKENIAKIAVKVLFKEAEKNADNGVARGKELGYDIHKLIIDDQTLIIMPYFEGVIMMDYLKSFISGHLNLNDVGLILKEVLKAVCALLDELDRFYRKGLIHNDGHMDNVLYDANHARYIDFEDVLSVSDAGESFCVDISQMFDNIKAINEWFKLSLLMAKEIDISDNLLDELVSYYKKIRSSCKSFQDKGSLIELLQNKIENLMAYHGSQLRFFDKSEISSQPKNTPAKQSSRCIVS